MATVPEMNEIASYYSDSDELFYEADCPYSIKSSFHDQSCSMNCSVCKSGIQLKITNERTSSMTFKKAVVIMVAVEKMKNKTRPSVRPFMDEDLLDILNSIFVEAIIPFENSDLAYVTDSAYRYFSSSPYRVYDTENKCFALQEFPGSAHLLALQLQGLNSNHEVKLSMASYSSQPFNSSSPKNPVALSILGRNLYLSCVNVGDRPELRLEEVNNVIKDVRDDSLLRFIFFKSDSGASTSVQKISSFESAACPNWYISTSQRENELVSMAQYHEQSAIFDFKLISDNQ
ncbi:interleukin-1 beta-like [Rhinatrema bivittatum]|uniref:interleukin-1 beta-like n=1 Tax=Rhinatrema bivittatum TaxID=194408 RepID=UPI00112BCB27|nr:interleukin-1 beta-like [Rhinatrema bivittatum]